MSTTLLFEKQSRQKLSIPPFEPDYVFFEPRALEYPLGKKLYDRFNNMNIPIQMTTSHNQVRGIPGETDPEKYRNAKRTLVVGVRKTLKFDTSFPSAEYALPLSTGCMGHCHYCYLQTTMGSKPYIRIYVNLEDIFEATENYIKERAPQITRFEAAGKVAHSGYPLGFIIAPIMIFDGWKEGYSDLLRRLKAVLPKESQEGLYFELITHRYTKAAKNIILERYPKTKLEMDEEKRKVKWGRYGKFKYIYPNDQYKAIQDHMYHEINTYFPNSRIEYFT